MMFFFLKRLQLIEKGYVYILWTDCILYINIV